MGKHKVTPELIQRIYELAKGGLNNLQIMECVNISHTTFYGSEDIVSSVKTAHNELRSRIATAMLEKVDTGDTTASIYLSKRLNVFDYGLNMHKITDAKTALTALTLLAAAEANGQIEESKSKRLEGIINSFLKGYELTSLEERISELEGKTNGK